MLRHKDKIVAVLIVLYAVYFIYEFVNYNVYPERPESGSVVRDFRNPLTVIFIGRVNLSEDGKHYSHYDGLGRTSYLIQVGLLVGMAAGLIHYWRSRRHRLLAVFLLMMAWRNIATLIFTFFYYSWNKVYPDNTVLLYYRDFFSSFEVILLVKIMVGLYILRNLTINHTADSPSPAHFQGMRGFHYLIDRFLLIVLGNSFFLYVYQLDRNSLYKDTEIWFTVSFATALFVCYFLCERLIGITPGKILTGTRVGYVHDPQKPLTTGALLMRTFARLIPFEALSFLSVKGGWHDRLSETTVFYAADGHWLRRHTRIITIMFSVMLVMVCWFLFGWVAKVGLMRCNACADSMELPQVFAMLLLPLAVVSFTGWLAAVGHYAMNLSSRKYPSSLSIYFVMVTWWIPLYNLGILNYTLKPMLESWEASGASEDIMQKLKRSASSLRVYFVWFNIFIFLAVISVKLAHDYREIDGVLLCVSVGVICWCIGTLKFCSAVDRAVRES